MGASNCLGPAQAHIFFLLHNFMDRRFVLTTDLNASAYDYFFFPLSEKVKLFDPTDISKLSASILLCFKATAKYNEGYWNISTAILRVTR